MPGVARIRGVEWTDLLGKGLWAVVLEGVFGGKVYNVLVSPAERLGKMGKKTQRDQSSADL